MVMEEYRPMRPDRGTIWTTDDPPPSFSGGSYRAPLTPVPGQPAADLEHFASAGLLGLRFDEAPRHVLYRGMSSLDFLSSVSGWWGRSLTDEQVLEIRARYAAGGVTQQRLADEYGVSRPTVSALTTGRYYADVNDEVA